MKKINKKLAIGFAVVLLVGLGVIFKDPIYRRLKSAITKKGDGGKFESLTKPKSIFKFDWKKWEDEAGFAFEYPEAVSVDVHPEDEINYANLELTKEGKPGKIVILCKDSTYSDIDDWLENDELVKGANALDTQVASISGKKAALANGREITGFIDWDEVIYTIELDSQDEDYWKQVYTHILDTFELIPLEGESQEEFSQWLDGFDTSKADIVEPVEVIE